MTASVPVGRSHYTFLTAKERGTESNLDFFEAIGDRYGHIFPLSKKKPAEYTVLGTPVMAFDKAAFSDSLRAGRHRFDSRWVAQTSRIL